MVQETFNLKIGTEHAGTLLDLDLLDCPICCESFTIPIFLVTFLNISFLIFFALNYACIEKVIIEIVFF